MTWSSKDGIRLGIGYSGDDGNRVNLPAGVTVASGQSYTFTYAVTAPASGNLSLYLQMVEEGITWFGEAKTLSIPVKNPMSAEIETITLSDNIKTGGAYTANITVKNTDTVTWTAADKIRLGVTGTVSGSNRVYLPDGVSVAPGASYTFIYSATAPASGDLIMTVQMLKENVAWFGESQTATVAARGAQITAVTAPAAFLAGQTQNMQIAVKNTGLMTWSSKDGIRLGIGYSGDDGNRVNLPAGVTVASGQSYTFTYAVTAPASGNLSLYLQMVEEGITWFGEAKTLSIPVKNPMSAEIETITLSDNIKTGGAYTANITVKNTDTVTWTAADKIRLGVTGTVSGSNRVYLPDGVSVAPGASYTFIYSAIAPASGDLTMTVQMLQEGVVWFGESQTLSSTVGNS